jgi:hypothetical protein
VDWRSSRTPFDFPRTGASLEVKAVVPAQRAAIKRGMHGQQIFNKARVCAIVGGAFHGGELIPGASRPAPVGPRPALNFLRKIESGNL